MHANIYLIDQLTEDEIAKLASQLPAIQPLSSLIILAVHANIFEPSHSTSATFECPAWLMASRVASRFKALDLMHALHELKEEVLSLEEHLFECLDEAELDIETLPPLKDEFVTIPLKPNTIRRPRKKVRHPKRTLTRQKVASSTSNVQPGKLYNFHQYYVC